MLNAHELDKTFNWGGTECDPSHGDHAGRVIKHWLSEPGRHLPPNPTYLALGVGQAYPEVAFARLLGIPPPKVTMVDRHIAGYTRERLKAKCDGVELVESGIFEYITNPPKRGFSVVGAFGIEYIFARKDAPETFVAAMKEIVSPDGIVFIRFYCGKNVDALWRKSGFEVLKGHTGSLSQLMYVKGVTPPF